MTLTKLPLKFWFLAGLLLRFTVLPFFAHEDFLTFYTKIFWAAEYQIYYPASQGYFWFLPHLWAYHPLSWLFPGLARFFISDPLTLLPDIPRLLLHPHTFRFLTVLKLPFLLSDLLFFRLCLALVTGEKFQKLVAIAWAFNPYLMYAQYLHGRDGALPLAFLALAYLLYQTRHRFLAVLSLGISAAMRFYPLLLAPLFLRASAKSARSFLTALSLLLLPVILDTWLSRFLSNSLVPRLQQHIPFTETALSASFPLGFGQEIHLVPVVIVAVYLFYSHLQPSFIRLWQVSYALLLVFLALVFFHPQYFAWLSFFFILSFAFYPQHHRSLLTAYSLQLLGWLLTLLYWGKGTTLALLQPIGPYLTTHYGSPLEYLNLLYPFDYVGLGRSLIFVSHLYLIYLLFTLKPTYASTRRPTA